MHDASGPVVATVVGAGDNEMIGECSNTLYYNYNAFVNTRMASDTISAKPSQNVADQGCIAGRGKDAFAKLCEFTCGLEYCPISACLCTKLGREGTGPGDIKELCEFGCQYGHCPIQAGCRCTVYGELRKLIGQCYPQKEDDCDCPAGLAGVRSAVQWMRCKTSIPMWW